MARDQEAALSTHKFIMSGDRTDQWGKELAVDWTLNYTGGETVCMTIAHWIPKVTRAHEGGEGCWPVGGAVEGAEVGELRCQMVHLNAKLWDTGRELLQCFHKLIGVDLWCPNKAPCEVSACLMGSVSTGSITSLFWHILNKFCLVHCRKKTDT